MTLSNTEARQRSEEIFEMVWGDDDKRRSYDALDVAVSDLYDWAWELESEPSPHKISNEEIAAELREIAERLQSINLDGAA